MKMKNRRHVIRFIKAGLSAIPLIGPPLESLWADYVTENTNLLAHVRPTRRQLQQFSDEYRLKFAKLSLFDILRRNIEIEDSIEMSAYKDIANVLIEEHFVQDGIFFDVETHS